MIFHLYSPKTNPPVGSFRLGVIFILEYETVSDLISPFLTLFFSISLEMILNYDHDLCFTFQAEHLRKKVTRFEDENESLMMQLKKMATRSRSTIKISIKINPLKAN